MQFLSQVSKKGRRQEHAPVGGLLLLCIFVFRLLPVWEVPLHAKTLSSILGHTKASFTLDTYTHVTGDMQKRAAGIVGDFMEEIFGKELEPWQKDEKTEREAFT